MSSSFAPAVQDLSPLTSASLQSVTNLMQKKQKIKALRLFQVASLVPRCFDRG